MNADTITNPIKIAIVGMTGSGKTVLVTTLAVKMAQMTLKDIYMGPYGDNRRQTLRYTQENWQTLVNGQWPPSTPAGELIQLQWELNTKNCQATVQFLDCAGQDIRSLFRTEYFNPASLNGDLRKVYESVNSANVLILLVNMKDLLATSNMTDEILDLDQMLHTLQQRNDIPRRMAVAFSQYDKYKPEVDQKFKGDFLEYVRHYIPHLYGQYQRFHKFELIPVAAVNDTREVIENGEAKQYPAPDFSSYNLETLIQWIANSVEEVAVEIAKNLEEERKRKEEEDRRRYEDERKRIEAENAKSRERQRQKDEEIRGRRTIALSVVGILLFIIFLFLLNNSFLHKKIGLGTKAGERKTILINGVEFSFRWCPPGSFMMGSPTEEKGRDSYETQHQVILTKGFWMMETEVTQKQWQTVMGNNPSCFKGDNLPVEDVFWHDCDNFCKACKKLGLRIQLPTEAQWEYACRAGSTGAFAGNLDEMAWYKENSGGKTHPVGTKKPNSWGLYDMHGNVLEWCADWVADYPNGSVTNPFEPSNGSTHIYRGGSWCDNASYCRSATSEEREFSHSQVGRPMQGDIGFRCVIVP